jgi:predicted dehydrogenase
MGTNYMMDELWLIGTGPMGVAYSEVLVDKNVEFRVVGRGEKSASAFRSKTGLNAQTGGIHNALSVLPPPKLAIVAVQEVHLYETTMALIRAGCKRVLIEKPGALAFSELEKMDKDATIAGTELYVAYNRRFHSSVSMARELIESDGGLQSIDFDFTEFSSVVENLPTANETKERWLLANSSHVIDLVFFLAGIPKAWEYFQSGSLDWHSSGRSFSGAGITHEHKVFSYLSDWGAPGRWRIEVRTSARKLLLQPLEGLKEMSRSSFEYGEVELDVKLDQKFKPGVWQMTTAFLDGREGILCTLNQHILHSRHYFEIAGYPLG